MKTRSNENNKNSAAKKIIPAVGMLALSATMLSTSTYAWFTMNKEVQMTGLSMTAAVGEGMEIALAEVEGTTITMNTTPADDKSDSWGSAVVVGDYYDSIGLLKPASSVDGKNLFDVTNASNGGRKAVGYKKIEDLDNSMAKVKARSALAEGGNIKADSDDASKGYYVDIPVHLRTNKTGSGESSVYCKLLINSKKYDPEDNKYNDLENDEEANLYKAVRVAFISNSGNETPTIFGADKDYYTTGKAVKSDTGDCLGPVNVTVENAVAQNDFTSLNGVDSGLTIPFASGAGQYGHLDFTVRVWLEGESTSCFNDNAGQSWNIDLAFSLGEFDTATTSEGVGA